MQISWAGQELELVATITTGEWYRAQFEIVAPQAQYVRTGDVRHSHRSLDAAYAFCSGLVTWNGLEVDREVLARLSYDFNADRGTIEDLELVYPHLFARIIEACSWGPNEPGMNAFYAVASGSSEFDPSLDDGPCDCEECKGRIPLDDGCLFRQPPIDAFARQMGAIDAELVERFWDKPYYLFRHAHIAQTHRAMRMAAIGQERKKNEKKREEEQKRREARELAWARVRNKWGRRFG